jgi:tetratricopeptide (TPR) repeat protein
MLAPTPDALLQRLNVFLSSTVVDLPTHRKEAMDAIWRAGMYPLAMERDTASSADAIRYSRTLADQADIYIGIIGFRYGKLRGPEHLSITEMEYRWALNRRLPVFIFLMHNDHLVKPSDVETNLRCRRKLDALKDELREKYVVEFFRSPEELRRQILQALVNYQMEQLRHAKERASRPAVPEASVHTQSASRIPQAPAPYLAHPYILTHRFCGHSTELARLDAWAASGTPMLIIDSIGGLGKSALVWHWLHERTPKLRPDLAGVVWWSFYESDATVSNFLRRTLAYTSGQPVVQTEELSRADQVAALLEELRTRLYLLVLDGLERILVAYHRLDAPSRSDEQVEGEVRQEGAQRASGSAGREGARLGRCTDTRDGLLLRQLAWASPSQVLISTRLLPEDLHDRGSGELLPGVERLAPEGLAPEDAVALWRALGVRGATRQMRTFLGQFGYHALLTEVLARRIRRYFPAPGDFVAWQRNEGADLRLAELDLSQRRTHILRYALDGLAPEVRKLLSQVAAFRYPVDYAALSALNPYLPHAPAPDLPPSLSGDLRASHPALEMEIKALEWRRQALRADLDHTRQARPRQEGRPAREGSPRGGGPHRQQALPEALAAVEARLADLEALRQSLREQKTVARAGQDEAQPAHEEAMRRAQVLFHQALTELEERGLLHWDRQANRYDLHPVVRAYALESLEGQTRKETYLRIRDHFHGLPSKREEDVQDLADLRGALEIYHALVGAELWDEASRFYCNQLRHVLVYRLGGYPTIIELLTPLFPSGLDQPPALSTLREQSGRVTSLANAYQQLGEASQALALHTLGLRLDLERRNPGSISVRLRHYAEALESSGRLASSKRALDLAAELAQATHDPYERAMVHLKKLWLCSQLGPPAATEGAVEYQAFHARLPPFQASLWEAEAECAQAQICYLSDRHPEAVAAMAPAWQFALQTGNVLMQWYLHVLRAELAWQHGRLEEAEHDWREAALLAQRSGLSPAEYLADLARVRLALGRREEAQHLLEQVLDENPDHPPHARLADVYLGLGEHEQAHKHALAAYQAAWGEGEPYIHWADLRRARRVLAALGVAEPTLLPFDPAHVQPLPHEEAIRALVRTSRAQRRPDVWP